MKIFKFKGLLEYITQIELLEELLYLASKTDLRLDLEGGKRSRSSKEDVVKLLKGHVTSCRENSEDTVLKFLLNNKDTIETQFTKIYDQRCGDG